MFPPILIYEKAKWYQCVALGRQARLNALRGIFHTRFAVEISAKYCENPTSGFALKPNILLLSIKYQFVKTL